MELIGLVSIGDPVKTSSSGNRLFGSWSTTSWESAAESLQENFSALKPARSWPGSMTPVRQSAARN